MNLRKMGLGMQYNQQIKRKRTEDMDIYTAIQEEAKRVNDLYTKEYGKDWESLTLDQLKGICLSKVRELLGTKICPTTGKVCGLDGCLAFDKGSPDYLSEKLSYVCMQGYFRHGMIIPSGYSRNVMEYSKMSPEELCHKLFFLESLLSLVEVEKSYSEDVGNGVTRGSTD